MFEHCSSPIGIESFGDTYDQPPSWRHMPLLLQLREEEEEDGGSRSVPRCTYVSLLYLLQVGTTFDRLLKCLVTCLLPAIFFLCFLYAVQAEMNCLDRSRMQSQEEGFGVSLFIFLDDFQLPWHS